MEWTRIDAAINRAAKKNYEESAEVAQLVGVSPNRYGEHIGAFEDGVHWAMKHYRLLGLHKKKLKK